MKTVRKTPLRGKLGGSRGESISETLIALLIASLAIVMLASMLLSSSNMVQQSKKAYTTYYAENSDLEMHVSSSETAKVSGVAALTDGTKTVQLIPSKDSVGVACYQNDAAAAYEYKP